MNKQEPILDQWISTKFIQIYLIFVLPKLIASPMNVDKSVTMRY